MWKEKQVIDWLINEGRVRTCPNCGGDKHFAKCLVQCSFYCMSCNRVWKFWRRIHLAGVPAFWYPKKKFENEKFEKVD